MKVVLFDAIQEEHVSASLERALTAAGHQVHSTGRIGRGFTFVDSRTAAEEVGAHLERITAFRPDLILVFRPASAPLTVLRRLRSTGAALAVWLSDDPVLFDLSYGPVIDHYDLILHCGTERVLQFYADRFNRPTGVNFPFWTDHTAFPVVYGRHPAESTAVFLGNVAGPVRRRRYEQLAALQTDVRIFGQVGDDPAGLGGGFLDTDREVSQALGRTKIALNIPQFFRDHRGLQTWFPGLDELGHFDLPSRVIQYGASGVPTVSIIPGEHDVETYPEVVVCDSFAAADDWMRRAVEDGTLEELSRRTVERFDRSFSAAARVMALESLMVDDSWRSLDAADRTRWFQQFDGTLAHRSLQDGPSPASSGTPLQAARPSQEPADVVVVHGRPPQRFGALDVVLRQLEADGTSLRVWGSDSASGVLTRVPGRRHEHLDVPALLAAVGTQRPQVLVLGDGIGLSDDGAAALRQAQIATVSLSGGRADMAHETTRFDVLVHVGPAGPAREAALRALPNGLHTPGLVESAFLDAVRAVPRGGTGAVRSGSDALSAGILGQLGAADEKTPDAVETASLPALAELLTRDLVYIQPSRNRGRTGFLPITAYAVCAAGSVVVDRHHPAGQTDVFGDWIIRAESPAEVARKLTWRGTGGWSESELERFRATVDARRQLDRWFRLATQALRAEGETSEGENILVPGVQSLLMLETPYRWELEPDVPEGQEGASVELTLEFVAPGLVTGASVHCGTQTLGSAQWPLGSATGVRVVLDRRAVPDGGPVSLRLHSDPLDPAPDSSAVLTEILSGPGPMLPAPRGGGGTVSLMPMIDARPPR